MRSYVGLYISLLTSLAVVPVLAIQLPESVGDVCGHYTITAKSRCESLYREAAAGSVARMVDIGISVEQLRSEVPDSTDVLSQVELSRQIGIIGRSAQWFRIAQTHGSTDASYWLAKALHDAFSIALLPAELPQIAERSTALLPQAIGIGSAAEAVVAAHTCADAQHPGCMELLGDFCAQGYGFDRATNRTNAAEWLVNAAVAFVNNGNREKALQLYERLTREYSEYPYLGVLRDHLFPTPTSPVPDIPSGTRRSEANPSF